jgi:hypothetical protein
MKKKEKELKRRYGKLAEGMEAYYDHLDLRFFSEMEDDGFAYIMTRVKGVNMLDLNETLIGNESIALLTKLDTVKELRLKGCHLVDDECIPHLNQLTQLEFLHLNHTGVTLDGLLRLTALTRLRTLLFSVADESGIGEKMNQLRLNLPSCAFVVNSRPYQYEDSE